MTRKSIKVSNITCAQCAKSIESYFEQLNHITAKVHVTSKKVIFEYDESSYDLDQIANHLRIIGYYPILNQEEQIKARRRERIDLFIAGILTFPLLWTMFNHLGIPIYVPSILMNGYVQWAIATPILFYVGRHFFKAAYHQIKDRNLGMDTLVVLGTSAAYIYSLMTTLQYQNNDHAHQMPELYFETTAVIIFMVLLGNYFENRVKEKTSNELQSLISLGAKEARLLKDGIEMLVPIDMIQKGDTVVVLANEKIPLDGTIIKGQSYIDEAMITGEPMPAYRKVGDQVIGSTTNTIDTLTILVTATGSDTVLSKIIKTVEDTALIKPKAQRVADRIAQLFVPVVVVISILVFLFWYLILNQGTDIGVAFAPAIAVLVISCPCALGLATPTSISVGSGIAFKQGILYKGGEFFEIANKISAIAFDKTGTLTEGEPILSDFIGEKDTLKISASLEAHSNHPIAKAIKDAYLDPLYEVTDFQVLIGQGVKGKILGKEAYVGSLSLVSSLGLKVTMDANLYLSQGKTVFFTVYDGKIINMIAVSDPIKKTAKGVISELKRRNITPYMITGDQEKTANYIANLLGIDHVFYEVLPHEKAEKIKSIQDQGHVVAFVGDGINDAPALKMADVGFAVGNGSDIAIDTSDVTLMTHDLGLVIKAIDLSLTTLKNIYLNFFWAFIYNIVMIPLAAIGLLNPSLAGIGMGFSSIMVVLNALSLNLFKFKEIKMEEIYENHS